MLRGLLRSMRPHQWAKNLFVLAPLVFAHGLLRPAMLTYGGVAFLCFCAASSTVYLFNDLRDREADRRHPVKRLRPIAAGTLPAPAAATAATALLLTAAVAGTWVGRGFLAVLAVYVLLNLGYSLGLKRVVILDVMIIGLGFVLRVLAGASAVGVVVSRWLLLCTIFLALFLAFSKRRHEIELLAADGAAGGRRVLEHYSPAFLDMMINVVTASAVVCYCLYAVAPETAEKYDTQNLVYTIPLVLFGIFRYLYLVYQSPGRHSPTEAILRDVPFLANLALWGLAVLWIVYRG